MNEWSISSFVKEPLLSIQNDPGSLWPHQGCQRRIGLPYVCKNRDNSGIAFTHWRVRQKVPILWIMATLNSDEPPALWLFEFQLLPPKLSPNQISSRAEATLARMKESAWVRTPCQTAAAGVVYLRLFGIDYRLIMIIFFSTWDIIKWKSKTLSGHSHPSAWHSYQLRIKWKERVYSRPLGSRRACQIFAKLPNNSLLEWIFYSKIDCGCAWRFYNILFLPLRTTRRGGFLESFPFEFQENPQTFNLPDVKITDVRTCSGTTQKQNTIACSNGVWQWCWRER